MKRRRSNPDPLITVAWAAGSAAVAGVVSYLVFREIAATKITQICSVELAKRLGQTTSSTPRAEMRQQALSML